MLAMSGSGNQMLEESKLDLSAPKTTRAVNGPALKHGPWSGMGRGNDRPERVVMFWGGGRFLFGPGKTRLLNVGAGKNGLLEIGFVEGAHVEICTRVFHTARNDRSSRRQHRSVPWPTRS